MNRVRIDCLACPEPHEVDLAAVVTLGTFGQVCAPQISRGAPHFERLVERLRTAPAEQLTGIRLPHADAMDVRIALNHAGRRSIALTVRILTAQDLGIDPNLVADVAAASAL